MLCGTPEKTFYALVINKLENLFEHDITKETDGCRARLNPVSWLAKLQPKVKLQGPALVF